MTEQLAYRPNVAAVIINCDGLILTCERSDFAGAWQIPQGGIEVGERPIDAFFRELDEEIGTTAVTIIGQLADPISYLWPKELHNRGFCGQQQWYFLARMQPNTIIDLKRSESVEFATCEWLTASEFFKRCRGFKANAYKQAIAQLAQQFPNTIKMD